MNAGATLKLIWTAIVTDKTIKAGATFSSLSLWGGYNAAGVKAWLDGWVPLYAMVIGALGSTALFILTCLKIWRLLRNPNAKE